jgi:putative acetyltransferase
VKTIDSLNIHVRREQPGDVAAVQQVNDAAFGQPDESRVVDAVRAGGGFLISPGARQPRALGVGPVAVLPALQRQGIGSTLVEAGLEECRRLACQAVVVVGHPDFYPRFGFDSGRACGLRSEFDGPDDVFMVLELTAGALLAVGGLVRYLPEFGGGDAIVTDPA